jgi:spoIIIJ-associated protein
MTDEKLTLEISASTVDEAVAEGLRELRLSKDQVEVEILDEGSRGLFGLGSRQSRVKLIVKENKPSSTPAGDQTPHEVVEPISPPIEDETESQPSMEKESETVVVSDEDQELAELVQGVVTDLLEKMKINAEVNTRYVEDDEERDRRYLLVDVQGHDLSILIGRKAETLNAFQYIISLIVNKQMGRMVPLVVDIQGYRERRTRQLTRLAKRMAEQAVKTHRRQVLEPMPANERRIMHLALRDHPDVITESIGDEPNRKVTILLKH